MCSREHHFSNSVLTVRPYQESHSSEAEETGNRVVVLELPPNIEEGMLELYFESEKHSGGGDILNIKIHPEHATAVIAFSEKSGE